MRACDDVHVMTCMCIAIMTIYINVLHACIDKQIYSI
jgi:hypothetical protein